MWKETTITRYNPLSKDPWIRNKQIISCSPTGTLTKCIKKRMKSWEEYKLEEIIDIQTMSYYIIILRTFIKAGEIYFNMQAEFNDNVIIEYVKKIPFNILFEGDVFKQQLIDRLNYYSSKIRLL